MTCLLSPTRLDIQHPGKPCTWVCGQYLFLEPTWVRRTNGGLLCTGFSGEDALATARKESANQREQPGAEREALGERSTEFYRRAQVM